MAGEIAPPYQASSKVTSARHERRWLVAATLALATLLVTHPPWRATAIRHSTRYAGTPGVEPLTLVDTIPWTVPFAPRYAPPRDPRGATPDASARSDVAEFERRYGVPDVLRTAGAAWRDSVLAAAGIPAESSYRVTFTVDDGRLALRLALLVLAAAAVDWWQRRHGDHVSRRTGT
jgi:hypothetical protein